MEVTIKFGNGQFLKMNYGDTTHKKTEIIECELMKSLLKIKENHFRKPSNYSRKNRKLRNQAFNKYRESIKKLIK